jgi:hypothetical protein
MGRHVTGVRNMRAVHATLFVNETLWKKSGYSGANITVILNERERETEYVGPFFRH